MKYLKFAKIFFTDEKHLSPGFQLINGIRETHTFQTARGSLWLAEALLQNGFQTIEEGKPSKKSKTLQEIFNS